MAAKKRFTILSGPSCVGKGPLVAALDHFHPDIKYAQIPVIKSRESRPKGPRPEEVGAWNNPDFFRSSQELLELSGNPQFLVGDCRGLPQAVDLDKVNKENAQLLFVEIYHTIGAQLVTSAFLRHRDVDIATVFVSPLGSDEIQDLRRAGVDVPLYLEQIMLHKQLVRARHQGMAIAGDARGRAADASSELKTAIAYSHVIVNHDGEGNPNWHRLASGAFTHEPEGDAGRAVLALVHILGGFAVTEAENWNGFTF